MHRSTVESPQIHRSIPLYLGQHIGTGVLELESVWTKFLCIVKFPPQAGVTDIAAGGTSGVYKQHAVVFELCALAQNVQLAEPKGDNMQRVQQLVTRRKGVELQWIGTMLLRTPHGVSLFGKRPANRMNRPDIEWIYGFVAPEAPYIPTTEHRSPAPGIEAVQHIFGTFSKP